MMMMVVAVVAVVVVLDEEVMGASIRHVVTICLPMMAGWLADCFVAFEA